MNRQRIKLAVWVDLDPVPGTFHNAADATRNIQALFDRLIPHYHPEVAYEAPAEERHVDKAVLIDAQMLRPGGKFFMVPEAVVGWYCIRSTDPNKRDLFLPAHIFNRCFRFYNEGDHVMMPDEFCMVQETI